METVQIFLACTGLVCSIMAGILAMQLTRYCAGVRKLIDNDQRLMENNDKLRQVLIAYMQCVKEMNDNDTPKD